MTNVQNKAIYDAEMEQCLLDELLLDYDAAMSESKSLLKIKEDDFYLPEHREVFRTITSLAKKTEPVNIGTVVKELESSGRLEKAGGYGKVAGLTDKIVSTANTEYYAKTVIDRAVRRQVVSICHRIHSNAHDMEMEYGELLAEAETEIRSVAEHGTSIALYTAKEITEATVKDIDARINRKGNTGIKSGIDYLDSKTGGFQPSELIIIGARPGMGKTAFALSILANIYHTVPSVFFSLEMSIEDIGKRLLSQISGIDGNKLRSGFLTRENHNTIIEKSVSIIDSSLYVVDAQGIQLGEITSASRRLVREKGIRIIFIDYIGLVKVSGTSQMPSWEVTAEITRSLKMLARELKVPVVALCQVSRDSEGKEPTLANLRGSGSVEQNADLVLFIHRKESNDDVQDAKLKIAKHRNGETGVTDISFYPRIAKFRNKKQEVTNGRF